MKVKAPKKDGEGDITPPPDTFTFMQKYRKCPNISKNVISFTTPHEGVSKCNFIPLRNSINRVPTMHATQNIEYQH